MALVESDVINAVEAFGNSAGFKKENRGVDIDRIFIEQRFVFFIQNPEAGKFEVPGKIFIYGEEPLRKRTPGRIKEDEDAVFGPNGLVKFLFVGDQSAHRRSF